MMTLLPGQGDTSPLDGEGWNGSCSLDGKGRRGAKPNLSTVNIQKKHRMRSPIITRRTEEGDFPDIIAITKAVYPFSPPWYEHQLTGHLGTFPEGQMVAVDKRDGKVVGMAASLILRWEDYSGGDPWNVFTASGTFANHNSKGETLYGAEIMVDPERQRMGIGKKLYEARRQLVKSLGLLRIRAGARPRGYHKYAKKMNIGEYARQVSAGKIKDPTLSFQIREGFHVVEAIADYLPGDTESLGYSVTIEWLNPDVASRDDFAAQDEALASL